MHVKPLFPNFKFVFYNHILTYVESRKMVQMDLVSGQEQRHRGREWMCGHGMGRGGWDELGG